MKRIFHIYQLFYMLGTVLLICSLGIAQIHLMVGENQTDGVNCQKIKYNKILDLCLNCFLAFLLGGIISDAKFIKFGNI